MCDVFWLKMVRTWKFRRCCILVSPQHTTLYRPISRLDVLMIFLLFLYTVLYYSSYGTYVSLSKFVVVPDAAES
jgi:hypothetical protein